VAAGSGQGRRIPCRAARHPARSRHSRASGRLRPRALPRPSSCTKSPRLTVYGLPSTSTLSLGRARAHRTPAAKACASGRRRPPPHRTRRPPPTAADCLPPPTGPGELPHQDATDVDSRGRARRRPRSRRGRARTPGRRRPRIAPQPSSRTGLRSADDLSRPSSRTSRRRPRRGQAPCTRSPPTAIVPWPSSRTKSPRLTVYGLPSTSTLSLGRARAPNSAELAHQVAADRRRAQLADRRRLPASTDRSGRARAPGRRGRCGRARHRDRAAAEPVHQVAANRESRHSRARTLGTVVRAAAELAHQVAANRRGRARVAPSRRD